MEGVAVGVGEPGQHHPAEPLVAGSCGRHPARPRRRRRRGRVNRAGPDPARRAAAPGRPSTRSPTGLRPGRRGPWPARRPRPGSRLARRTRRGSARRRSGCGRTASRSGCRPRRGCRRRGRRRSPAGERRAGPRAARSARGRRASRSVQDSAVSRAPPAAATAISATAARTAPSSAPRASSQPVTRARDGVDPVRPDDGLAHGGQAAVALGRLAGGEHRTGEAEHRVLPVVQRGGAGVVGLAGEVESPPAVRPDAGADADRAPAVDQSAALLDVQLDEGADPAQGLRIGADPLRDRGRRARTPRPR